MEALNTYKTEKTLAEQMNERLAEMKMTKADLDGMAMGGIKINGLDA